MRIASSPRSSGIAAKISLRFYMTSRVLSAGSGVPLFDDLHNLHVSSLGELRKLEKSRPDTAETLAGIRSQFHTVPAVIFVSRLRRLRNAGQCARRIRRPPRCSPPSGRLHLVASHSRVPGIGHCTKRSDGHAFDVLLQFRPTGETSSAGEGPTVGVGHR